MAFDYSDREVPFKFNPLTKSIEVTALSRDPVYFVAPGKWDHITTVLFLALQTSLYLS